MRDIMRAEAEATRALYKAGRISHEEAKRRIGPYAEAFNEKSRELARKYNQRAKLFSFASYMR